MRTSYGVCVKDSILWWYRICKPHKMEINLVVDIKFRDFCCNGVSNTVDFISDNHFTWKNRRSCLTRIQNKYTFCVWAPLLTYKWCLSPTLMLEDWNCLLLKEYTIGRIGYVCFPVRRVNAIIHIIFNPFWRLLHHFFRIKLNLMHTQVVSAPHLYLFNCILSPIIDLFSSTIC